MQPIDEFRAILAENGLDTDGIEPDGKLHRCRTHDDKGKKKSGWYVYFDDGIAAGAYGNWKTDIAISWCSREVRTLSAAERRQLHDNMLRARALRESEAAAAQAAAAVACREIWANARDATDSSGYAKRKGITPYGCKMFGDRDVLIVPIYRARGELVNLQFIQADGAKRFKTGGEKRGCYTVIGRTRASKIMIICEGFATGASIHEATGLMVVVAFDAGNLEPVAVKLRAASPDWQIIIAGDNDANGIGQAKAMVAATLVRAAVVIPDFSGLDAGDTVPSDFNDLQQLAGFGAVWDQILARPVAAEPADVLLARVLTAEQLAASSQIFDAGRSVVAAIESINSIAITHRIPMGSVQCPQLALRMQDLAAIMREHTNALGMLQRLPVAPALERVAA